MLSTQPVADRPTPESVAAERAAQGFPPTVTDPAALARVTDALRGRTGPKAGPDTSPTTTSSATTTEVRCG